MSMHKEDWQRVLASIRAWAVAHPKTAYISIGFIIGFAAGKVI